MEGDPASWGLIQIRRERTFFGREGTGGDLDYAIKSGAPKRSMCCCLMLSHVCFLLVLMLSSAVSNRGAKMKGKGEWPNKHGVMMPMWVVFLGIFHTGPPRKPGGNHQHISVQAASLTEYEFQNSQCLLVLKTCLIHTGTLNGIR